MSWIAAPADTNHAASLPQLLQKALQSLKCAIHSIFETSRNILKLLDKQTESLPRPKSALKESEELAMREKEMAQSASDMMNNMLEKLPTGVVIVDNNLKILHSNHQFHKYYW